MNARRDLDPSAAEVLIFGVVMVVGVLAALWWAGELIGELLAR